MYVDNKKPTETLTKPDFKDAMNAISILEDYSPFTKFGVDLRKTLSDAGRVRNLDKLSNMKQSRLNTFSAMYRSYHKVLEKKKI